MYFCKPLPSIMRLFVSSVSATALTLLLATAASAYTLVLHDGRRLEIPATFVLTQATLTYEVAPAINKTVAVVLIDIAATERANNQPAGSFFARRGQVAPVTETPRAQHARTTLTNQQLEPLRQQRIESEKRYEQRRIELGLPSVEESRRIQQRAENEMLEQARERQRDESYWRARATALRDEIASVDVQINYLRSRLADNYQSQFATNGVLSAWPFAPLGNRTAPNLRSTGAGVIGGAAMSPGFQTRGPFQPRAFRSPLTRPQFRTTRVDPFDFRFGRPRGLPGAFFPARPFEYFEDTYDAASLTESLNGLLTTRAGLSASWRQLEDEARNARVPQVWLEP